AVTLRHLEPALVIVLNGPTVENNAWIPDDHKATTRDFLTAVQKKIDANTVWREMAKKHGGKTMKELLVRNFSSVCVRALHSPRRLSESQELCAPALFALSFSRDQQGAKGETGGKCVNTNDGHAKGHQSVNGGFLAIGGFVVGDFNLDRLLGLVNNCVAKILKDINKDVESSRETRRLYAVYESLTGRQWTRGGLVALGPGAHNFSFQECITCFKALYENGFENERGARN
ncbi:hypothetical protein CEP53_015101, partial [Fusarium sp. AF-6]